MENNGKQELNLIEKIIILLLKLFIIVMIICSFSILLDILGFDPDIALIKPKIEKVDMEISVPKFKIVRVGDNSYGPIYRYGIDVIVEEEINREQFKKISNVIIENFKKNYDANAIMINYYDRYEYIRDANTLGQTCYAPFGEWERADEVRVGKYAKMGYTYNYKEKDWSNRPTKEEAEIYKRWNIIYNDIDSEINVMSKNVYKVPSTEEVDGILARELDISKERLDEILLKNVKWITN